MAKKQIALVKLVEDFSLYPRNHVDTTHVSDLVRALQSGQDLPPIIADAETLRIVDGFHRNRAYRKHLGDEAVVTVELRKYKSEAELFLDAVALNAHHGRKLDRHDQSRIVLMLREMKVDDHTIAVSLHIPEANVQTLSVRVVYEPNGDAFPAKRGMKHLHGQTMTADQLRVIGSVRSAEAGRLCLELSRLLDTGLVDLDDQQIIDRLRALTKSIESALHAVAA